MPEETASEEARLIAAAEQLTHCDGYVVLAVDPQTGEVDAHGPFDGLTATIKADQLRATSTTVGWRTSRSVSCDCTAPPDALHLDFPV